jgi:hypothetical protein
MGSPDAARAGSQNWDGDFNVGISASGVASRDVADLNRQDLVASPKSSSVIARYETPNEVRDAYFMVYPESLALAGLVAQGLRAFDLELSTVDAKALFNDWQDVRQQPRLGAADKLWTASQDPYLTEHLAPTGS